MIRITAASMDGNLATLYLETDWPFSKLKQLIESQLNIPSAQQVISLNGQVINATENTPISTLGINSDDILLAVGTGAATNIARAIPPSNAHTTPALEKYFEETSKTLINQWKNNPSTLQILGDAELAAAISTGDQEKVRKVVEMKHWKNVQNELNDKIELNMAAQNPLSPESQRIFEKHLHKQRIQESFIHSQEYFPESYGDVDMLFINIELNKNPILAFVDTGAQKTIISKACAEKCNISHLIDSRFGGVVQGVGVSKMLGRIHMVDMKINDTFYPISCVVLESPSIDFLLGLDILKRYQCQINLADNSLTLQGNKTHFTTPASIPSASTAASETAMDSDKEGKISTLCNALGISRAQAKYLLESSNWDIERAASLSLSLQ